MGRTEISDDAQSILFYPSENKIPDYEYDLGFTDIDFDFEMSNPDDEVIVESQIFSPDRSRYSDHVPSAWHAILSGTYSSWQRYNLGNREHTSGLPHRFVSDHGTGHQRKDAFNRAFDVRGKPF